jgi:hypothetical protein
MWMMTMIYIIVLSFPLFLFPIIHRYGTNINSLLWKLGVENSNLFCSSLLCIVFVCMYDWNVYIIINSNYNCIPNNLYISNQTKRNINQHTKIISIYIHTLYIIIINR